MAFEVVLVEVTAQWEVQELDKIQVDHNIDNKMH
jgi:hypothetical protein